MIPRILVLIIVSILVAGCISAPEKPPEENATIQLSSSPAGAEVLLDNESQGSTPVVIANVRPGNHTIEYRLKGYRNWQETVTVPSGKSNFFTALTVKQAAAKTTTPVPVKTGTPRLTAKASRNPLIIGDPDTFSGIATDTSGVSLTLFGPGYYADGILLDKVSPNSGGLWNYKWSPGDKIRPGSYSLIVANAEKTASAEVQFAAIGNGEVTVTMNSYAVGRGDTAAFRGMCTTGAPNIRITLFGPGRYVSGVDLATVPVTAEETWSYKFPVDKSMQTGLYTVSVSDVPKTSTGTKQFTIGFA
jgi:hypothetical protein